MIPFVCRLLIRFPRNVLIGAILGYRWILSPLKNALLGPGGCCRFYPTCSDYALQSIRTLGVCKGLLAALVRLSKCHPFHRGGYDPVSSSWTSVRPAVDAESILDVSEK